MTREEFIEQYLKPLIVKVEPGSDMEGLVLISPEDYKQFKRDFNFTDEDVKRWAKGDLT